MNKNQEQENPNFVIFEQKFRLKNNFASIEISQYGGQILSYTQNSQKDIFWLSNNISPPPSAIRGGVPVCWPWFAKQGVANEMPQHGPMRNMPWTVLECITSPNLCEIKLVPQWNEDAENLSMEDVDNIQKSKQLLHTVLDIEWHEIDLIQTFKLSNVLEQRLETHNKSNKTILLTQALHSYFAVADAMTTTLKGFDNLFFTDKLQTQLSEVTPQKQDIQLNNTNLSSIDRIYHLTHIESQQFQIHDTGNDRVIQVNTIGSQSVVVWNPGASTASQMQDVGEKQWASFFCLEVANALPHAISLAPKQKTCLGQIIELI